MAQQVNQAIWDPKSKSLLPGLFLAFLIGMGLAIICLNLFELSPVITVVIVTAEAIVWGISWQVIMHGHKVYYPVSMQWFFGLLGIVDPLLVGIYAIYTAVNLLVLAFLLVWALLNFVLTLLVNRTKSDTGTPAVLASVAITGLGAALAMGVPATATITGSELSGPTYLNVRNVCSAPLTLGPLDVFGQKLADKITIQSNSAVQKIETPPLSIHIHQEGQKVFIKTALDGTANFEFLGQVNQVKLTYNGTLVNGELTARLSDKKVNDLVVTCG